MSAIRIELCNAYDRNDIANKLSYYNQHTAYSYRYYTRNIYDSSSIYAIEREVYGIMLAENVAYGRLFISKNIQFNADDNVDLCTVNVFASCLAKELGSMGPIIMPVVVGVHDITDKGIGNYHVHFTMFNYDYAVGGKVLGFGNQYFDTLLVATINTALHICKLSQCDYRYINTGKIYTPPMIRGILNIPGFVPWRIIA